MKILQINTVYPTGSTGRIAAGIRSLCLEEGMDCVVAHRYPEGEALPDTVAVSSWWDCHVHNRLARLTMLQGCFSYGKTRRFLRWVERYDPDVIHLHNLHGSYINHRLLFRFLRRWGKPVVWTLHDGWAFTGYCAYYDRANCAKWKTACGHCPQKKGWLDLSRRMHRQKKVWFSGLSSLVLAANSRWTAAQAKQSFLKEYPIEVVYSGVDLSVFRPTESDFRARHGCEGKHLVLGVAFGWNGRKGLDVFIELARRLPESYQIVLVGTDAVVERLLPPQIISVHRTSDPAELAAIYTAADVFANPTREEAFGLVNIEALACGTPGVTFCTGGSPECFDDTCGCVVEKDDIAGMERELRRICETKPYRAEDCIARARRFEQRACLEKYMKLYRGMCHE